MVVGVVAVRLPSFRAQAEGSSRRSPQSRDLLTQAVRLSPRGIREAKGRPKPYVHTLFDEAPSLALTIRRPEIMLRKDFCFLGTSHAHL